MRSTDDGRVLTQRYQGETYIFKFKLVGFIGGSLNETIHQYLSAGSGKEAIVTFYSDNSFKMVDYVAGKPTITLCRAI